MIHIKRVVLGIVILLVLTSLSACPFEQFVAHYANEYGFTTRIKIQNPHSIDINVTIRAYDNDGTLQATANVVVPGGGFYTNAIEDIFGQTPIPGTGSLRIISDEPTLTPKVSSIILFDYNNGPALGGLQSFHNIQKVLNFPWFENSPTFSTGIAVLNVNPWTIQVILKAGGPDGTIYNSTTQTLAPMQRIIGYPGDFFPDKQVIPEDATLSVHASGNVAGFIILHNNDLSKIEAINGVPQIVERTEFTLDIPEQVLDVNYYAIQMIFSPDGNFIYLRSEAENAVIVIDRHMGAKGQIVSTIPMTGAGEMALSADGRYLYVGDSIATKICRISTSDYTLEDFKDGVNPMLLSRSTDGKFLAAVNDSNYHLINLNPALKDKDIIEPFPEGADIKSCTFTEDSEYLLAVDSGHNVLYAIASDGTLSSYPIGSPDAYSIRQQPGNGMIFIGHRSEQISVFNYPSFSLSQPLTAPTSLFYMLDFSPDGRFLYAPSFYGQTLYVFDMLKDSEIVVEYNLDGSVIGLACAPEGRSIYFVDLNNSSYPLMRIY